MKKISVLVLLMTIIVNQLYSKKYMVFLLAGQSNMVGHGLVKELPKRYIDSIKGVMIFDGSSLPDMSSELVNGIWSQLRPGHGKNFICKNDTNKYSSYFGIEITFASELKKQLHNKNIAIIKYARSGTSIEINAARQFGCWDPDYNIGNGLNQYDFALQTIKSAMSIKDIDNDGEADVLIPSGIIWMQGESDAEDTKQTAEKYNENLKKIMRCFRAAFLNNDLPIIIGRISDSGQDYDGKVWNYGDIVRQQQQDFVNDFKNTILVTSTDKYGYSDKWHYDTEGHIELGIQFAKTFVLLMEDN